MLGNRLFDLHLVRRWFTTRSTQAEIYFNDQDNQIQRVCFIQEDEARPYGVKIPKHTCIPPGMYKVRLTYSNRFKKILPIIYNVEKMIIDGKEVYYVISDGINYWTGVRFHIGNTIEDTEACPLPGLTRNGDWVGNSTDAMENLEAAINYLIKITSKEELDLKISHSPVTAKAA